MSDAELVDIMVAARRSASRMQAAELAAVAELARRRDAEDEVSGVGVISARDYLGDEVASALTLTATSADGLIRFATELTGRLPVTFAALAAGELDYAKAHAVWHGTAQVSDEVTAEIERRVLPGAPEQTTGEIRAKIRRLVKRLDPDTLARRRECAQRQRDVQLMETDDGTAHLTGLDLPADAAIAARNRVNAIATGLKTDGDRRGIGQLRADVFLALLSGTLTTTEPPADPTDRQTTGQETAGTRDRREDDWTGIDDAVADAIAQAGRAHLTSLSGRIPGQGPLQGNETLGEFLARTTRAHPRATGTRLHSSGSRLATHARLIAHAAGLLGRDVPERHQRIAELIHQAGERMAHALAGLNHGDDGRQSHQADGDQQTRWSNDDQQTRCGNDDQQSQWGNDGRQGDAQRDQQGQDRHGGRAGPHGHDGYRVPARMRRLIEYRDRRCCFPGCRRPVRHCDVDHTIPYHRGGPTCPCNLAMLCRHHHTLKQTRGWRLEQLWPGVLLWISPTGHWRITAPPDRE